MPVAGSSAAAYAAAYAAGAAAGAAAASRYPARAYDDGDGGAGGSVEDDWLSAPIPVFNAGGARGGARGR
jgi:hypothetical protein